MDRIAIFIFVLFFTQLTIEAQTIIDKEHNLPLAGDELRKVLINEIDYNSKVIDLTDKIRDTKLRTVKYISKPEYPTKDFIKTDDGARFDYSLLGEGLFLNSYENNQMRAVYQNPLKILSYPFIVGDSLGSSFEGTGMYVDKIPYTCIGESTTQYHSSHTLVTPAGDSIQPVYTICNVSNSVYKLENEETNRQFSIFYFSSYTPGYRYPILETINCYEEEKPVSSVSYYYPLDKQPYSEHDVTNRELLRKLEENDNGAYGEKLERLVDYKFSFQPINCQVNINFSTSVDCQIDFVLASIGGIVYRHLSKQVQAYEVSSLSLSCAGLPLGQYAVYISIGNEKYTEKFNIK